MLQKADSNIIEQAFNEINENIDEAVAIGESGLDFHEVTDLEGRHRQIKVFSEFIDMAVEYEMPLILHVRDAENRAFEMVKNIHPSLMWFFTATAVILKQQKIIEEGYYLSFRRY